MRGPGTEDPPPRSRLWLRTGALGLLLLTGFVLVRFTPLGDQLTEERITALLTSIRRVWWAPLVLVGLYTLLAPLGIPTAPLLVGGAVFGAVHGSVYNLAGLMLGAVLAFHVGRALGRDFVVRVTGRRLRRVEGALRRRGFWPLVQTRFLPLPFPVVNFGAALAGVRPGRFLAASFVGLLPSTVIHTVFIAELMEGPGSERALVGALYGAVFVAFNLVIGVPWLRREWRRRRRYRRLREQRRTSRSGSRGAGQGVEERGAAADGQRPV